MSDLRKAAEMALEALEANLGKWAAKAPAIEALRQALEEPEHEPLVWMNKYGYVASFQNEEHMTKEEAWQIWMKESKHYVEHDWEIIKKSSWWEAFSRGWDAATVNANGWDDAYKMGLEAGKEMK